MERICSRYCFNDGICVECYHRNNSATCKSCQCFGPWIGDRCHKRKHNLQMETSESPGARVAAITIPLLAIALIAIISAILVMQWRRRLVAHQRHVEHRMLTEEVDMGIDAV